MIAAKLSSTLCALLCASLAAADGLTVFNKTEKIHEVHSINIRNSLMAAVLCDEPLNFSVPIQKCNITHTTLDNQGKSASCQTILGDKLHAISAHPLTESKAVLIARTTERSDDKFSNYVWVYNFPDCKNTVSKITFESMAAAEKNFEENKDAILINDDDTFDVLYNDAKVCGEKLCRQKFDAEGNKVKGPVASFVPLVGAYRVIKKVIFSENFLVIELKVNEAYRISLLTPDGQLTLKEYETYDDLKDHDLFMRIGSTRLCSQTNTTKIECEFRYSDIIQMISFVAPQRVETVTITNLVSDDEFLLLGEYEETSTLMKVKGYGSVIGAVELSHFACDIAHESYLEVQSLRYCVIRHCTSKGDLKILKECYLDGDFH